MTDQGMESWDDERLAEIIHRGVRAIRAGVSCSGARVKVDGFWVLVSIERSSSQAEHAEGKAMTDRWYPEMPPMLPGESIDQYTDRLTGADRTGRVPYDHHRNRQCSLGWHEECTDPAGERCKCPCHSPERQAAPHPR